MALSPSPLEYAIINHTDIYSLREDTCRLEEYGDPVAGGWVMFDRQINYNIST